MKDAQAGSNIRLVLGVSSVGKSTYIAQNLAHDPSARVVLAYEITPSNAAQMLDAGGCIVHYNMLRPHDNDPDLYDRPLQADSVMAELLARRSRIAATVLVARPSIIAKRILLRGAHEPALRPAHGDPYPAPSIFGFLCRIPVAAIYDRWFELLSAHSIAFQILSAEDERFQPVERLEDARRILSAADPAAYTESEKSTALGRFAYAYQRFDEIADFAGSGADRSATLSAIRPHLAGETALDIGCGPGFFCFALEKMGFRDVVGTEVKSDRFGAACAVKEVTGSRCRFLLRDVFANPLQTSFDTVLMLNVLHHLRDPIAALEHAASMCRKRLIVEFATLADAKFAGTSTEPPQSAEAMPLIGVSLLSSQDQTFLFSPEALRRICLDHARLFGSIEFAPSPLSPTRRLAICAK